MAYEPKPWERVEDGILYGPGYVVDLADGELLHFGSPSSMGYGPKRVLTEPVLRRITEDVVEAGGGAGKTYVRYDSNVDLGDMHSNGDIEGIDVVTRRDGTVMRVLVNGRLVDV